MIDFDNNMFIFGRYETLNIRIKKNATNGEVIKALFSVHKEKITDYGTIKVYGFDSEKMPTEFLLDWWNAPYKKGESNEI